MTLGFAIGGVVALLFFTGIYFIARKIGNIE